MLQMLQTLVPYTNLYIGVLDKRKPRKDRSYGVIFTIFLPYADAYLLLNP